MKDPFKEFSKDHVAFETIESSSLYLIKWLSFSLMVAVVTYALLPAREDAVLHFSNYGYHAENILWFILSALGATGIYYSSFPQNNSKLLIAPLIFVVVTLSMMTAGHSDLDSLGLNGEMDLWRGRCGFLISGVAFLHGSLMFKWAKRGAAAHPLMTGMWIGLSAASLGCLIMQFVCAHDNTLHLLLWHFAPLLTICTLGSFVAKKMLRW